MIAKILSLFGYKKQLPEVIEQKSSSRSVSPWESGLGSFANFLFNSAQYDLSALMAIDLYSSTGPVATAIDILSEEYSSLKLKVFDGSKDEFLVDHPVLELLKNPNIDSTKAEFMQRYAAFYLITGNSYLLATGFRSSPPLELFVVYPQSITLHAAADGFLETLFLSTAHNGFIFRRENEKGRFRFLEGNLREIFQVKRFNPATDNLAGQSKLSPISPEIDQYRDASLHNSSLLKRGARPSLVILGRSDNEGNTALDKEQFVRLREQVQRFSGAQSAGGAFLFEGGKNMDVKDMIVNNRDMDFRQLKQDNKDVIFNHLGIPLPFVNQARQNQKNMGEAKLQLYDNAVLPLADRLNDELTNFLMPRYPDSENLKITYDVAEIPALKLRRSAEVKRRGELKIYSPNELRTQDGEERSESEGMDTIWRPSNEVPVGTDSFIEDQNKKPKQENIEDEE